MQGIDDSYGQSECICFRDVWSNRTEAAMAMTNWAITIIDDTCRDSRACGPTLPANLCQGRSSSDRAPYRRSVDPVMIAGHAGRRRRLGRLRRQRSGSRA
jgi:hypothetical protein